MVDPPRPPWLSSELFPFESRFADIDGNRVHYVDEGSGPVVLFVHGNPDFSFLYRHQIADLRGSYRCVAFDMPGFGLSEAVSEFGFTPEEQASVLKGLIERLDLRSVWMVVHDWGGPIGLRAAQQLSGSFAGLIVTGTLAWPDYRTRSPWWVRLMMGFLGGTKGRSFTLRNNLILEGPLRSEMKKGTHPPSEEVKDVYRGPFPTVESRIPTWVLAHHLWTATGEEFLTSVEQDLFKLRDLPTLFVFGGVDKFTTAKQSLPRFQQGLPNHETVIIPGAGHFFPESAPEATTDAIHSWLDKTV